MLKGRNSVQQHLGSFHSVIDKYLLDDAKDISVLPIEMVEAVLNEAIKEEADDDGELGAIAEDDDGDLGAIAEELEEPDADISIEFGLD